MSGSSSMWSSERRAIQSRIPAPKEFAAWLRAVADEVDALSGPARFPVLLFHATKGDAMGEITVKDEVATLNATTTFLDAKGAETAPDDVPQWSSTDEAVASVAASDDGRSATVTIGQPGAAVIEVRSTETDEESGSTSELVAQGTVTVQPGDAVIGNVEFAQP